MVDDAGTNCDIGAFKPAFSLDDVRCFPAWTRRIDVVGADVRSERSCRRVGTEVSDGMVRGIAGSLCVSEELRQLQ